MFNYQISQGALTMDTIRMLRSGQITLPAKIRHSLGLDEGALFQVVVENNHIVLTPSTVMPQDRMKSKLFKTLNKIWERNKDLDPQEVEKIVDEAVQSVRAAKRK